MKGEIFLALRDISIQLYSPRTGSTNILQTVQFMKAAEGVIDGAVTEARTLADAMLGGVGQYMRLGTQHQDWNYTTVRFLFLYIFLAPHLSKIPYSNFVHIGVHILLRNVIYTTMK